MMMSECEIIFLLFGNEPRYILLMSTITNTTQILKLKCETNFASVNYFKYNFSILVSAKNDRMSILRVSQRLQFQQI